MATPSFLRPCLNSSTRSIRPHAQRRHFLPNPFDALPNSQASPQVLKAQSTLPFPSAPVYSIIADVPSYQQFVPYCTRSDITKWSAPDKTYGRKWPSEGFLTSGFGQITESFASKVYCVPGRFVESVGGDAETSLNPEDIAHHLEGSASKGAGTRRSGDNGLLKHLRSKWEIQSLGKDRTRVSLVVEFAFANPIYAALSGGVAPKVADFMVKAFEKRVQELYLKSPEMFEADLSELDGSKLTKR